MHKRTIAIPLSILAAGGLAGGAYAATQSGSGSPQAFLNDAAHRLHVSPAQLSSALKQAFIDQINAAAAAGHLTRAQANAIEQKIEHAPGLPLPLLPGLVGPGLAGPGQFRFQMKVPGMLGYPGPGMLGLPVPRILGPPAVLSGAASYLGLTEKQLMQQLNSGKTLAQIAAARGKSKTGLEQAITAAFKSQLQKAVSSGRLPRAFEQRLLQAFSQHVADLVNGARLQAFSGKLRGGPPPAWSVGPGGPSPRGSGFGSIPPPAIIGWAKQ
jgi:AraC-like DNA-binding protein